MKKLLTVLTVGAVLFNNIAHAETSFKMRPLADYIKQNGGIESSIAVDATGSYIGARCFSLYTAMAVPFKQSKGKEVKELEDKLNNLTFLMWNFAKFTNQSLSQKQFDAWLGNVVKVTGREYIESINQSYAETGNNFDGPLVASDMKTCGEVSAFLTKIIQGKS